MCRAFVIWLVKGLLLFSCSVVSDSLWPYGLQHTRLLCPSLFPGVCSNFCLLSQWCYLTVSSYVAPFSSCPPSFLTSGGQSIGASASASVLLVNIQAWFPCCSRDFRVFSSTTIQKHHFFSAQPSLWSSSHIGTWLLEKWLLWLYGPLLEKWCLGFLILSLGFSQLSFQGAIVF